MVDTPSLQPTQPTHWPLPTFHPDSPAQPGPERKATHPPTHPASQPASQRQRFSSSCARPCALSAYAGRRLAENFHLRRRHTGWRASRKNFHLRRRHTGCLWATSGGWLQLKHFHLPGAGCLFATLNSFRKSVSVRTIRLASPSCSTITGCSSSATTMHMLLQGCDLSPLLSR